MTERIKSKFWSREFNGGRAAAMFFAVIWVFTVILFAFFGPLWTGGETTAGDYAMAMSTFVIGTLFIATWLHRKKYQSNF